MFLRETTVILANAGIQNSASYWGLNHAPTPPVPSPPPHLTIFGSFRPLKVAPFPSPAPTAPRFKYLNPLACFLR